METWPDIIYNILKCACEKNIGLMLSREFKGQKKYDTYKITLLKTIVIQLIKLRVRIVFTGREGRFAPNPPEMVA